MPGTTVVCAAEERLWTRVLEAFTHCVFVGMFMTRVAGRMAI